MMSDETDNNIVQLVQLKRDEEKLNVVITDKKSTGQKYCKHNQTQISEANRTLICRQCGSMLDPFEVILDRARSGENIVSEIKSLSMQNGTNSASLSPTLNAKRKRQSAVTFHQNIHPLCRERPENAEQGVKQWLARSCIIIGVAFAIARMLINFNPNRNCPATNHQPE